jgi:hypothetical protein
MRFRPAASVVALGLAAFAAPSLAALSFSPFVTSGDLSSVLGNNATIGFAYAGDKFVGSVYFGANNDQLYSTNLLGGGVAKFGAPLANGFGGEIYVTASLGIGGYGPRDVFAGSQNGGTVIRLAHDGSSQGVFASGLAGGVRSLAFDPFGNYGNQLIAATNQGKIYTISNTGVATLLASVGEDTEGLSFTQQAFGPYAAGTLFVASEGSGTLRAITPTGTVSTVITGVPEAEMVSFVPLNLGMSGNPVEGFYASNYPVNIIKADASQFLPYLGDAIVTSEFGVAGPVWDIHYDAGTQTFVKTQIGAFPNQPEDGIFVTAEIIRNPVPEPETYALMLAGLGVLGWVQRRRTRKA